MNQPLIDIPRADQAAAPHGLEAARKPETVEVLGVRIEAVGPITLFSGQKQIGRTAAVPTIRVRA